MLVQDGPAVGGVGMIILGAVGTTGVSGSELGAQELKKKEAVSKKYKRNFAIVSRYSIQNNDPDGIDRIDLSLPAVPAQVVHLCHPKWQPDQYLN
jgi:hypothetical protein